MYKVLLIDDEPAICDLLLSLIEWDNLSLVCVGTAGDGQEALRLIDEHHPKIVITDIQLPSITGLELIEQSLKKPNAPEFIVISGYHEFEFAQKALRLGVEDYILKPISKNEINYVLRHLTSKIKLSDLDSDANQKVRDALKERTFVLRQSELKNLILTSLEYRANDYLINTNYFNFNEEDGLFLFFWMRIQLAEVTEASCKESRQILDNVADRVRNRLMSISFDLEMCKVEENYIGLMNYSPKAHGSIEGIRAELQRVLIECNAKYLPHRLVIALGKPVASIRQLSNAFLQVRASIDMRIRVDISRVIEYNQPHEDRPTITEREKNEFLDLLICSNKKEARSFVLRMFERILNENPSRIGSLYGELYWMFRDVSETLKAKLSDGVYGGDQSDEPFDDPLLMYRVHNCMTVDDLQREAIESIEKEIDYWQHRKENLEGEPIRIAKAYIQANFSKQIRLEDIAAEAYVSPAYLGILFKQKTGCNLSDYFTEVRMEHAKRLLRETCLPIKELAEQVGYNDPRYFNKIFRRNFKVTPSVYRKFYT